MKSNRLKGEAMNLDQQIKEALFSKKDEYGCNHSSRQYIKCAVIPNKKKPEFFEISFGERDNGEPPTLKFSNLLILSKIFGTEEIDVDNYCNSEGCDTCESGSDYGHTIQIYNATKNVGEFYALVSKGTF